MHPYLIPANETHAALRAANDNARAACLNYSGRDNAVARRLLAEWQAASQVLASYEASL